ncbi:MAG: magnesium protoporphyrin IX methyltransferase [Pseudomonadota bacterium]
MDYGRTLSRVETYFDKTATATWERLTSDAPVSRVRQTVRAGRDRMRAIMLDRLPADLTGARVLDAGCGAGQMTVELAKRGARVIATDISPSLVNIAELRLPYDLKTQVSFCAGDMLNPDLGNFDYVLAMDSLIYYGASDIAQALKTLSARTSSAVVFTVAPRTGPLMAMWYAGKLFPRSDRSPIMVPHSFEGLDTACRAARVGKTLRPVERVTSGFYISQALEVRG